MGSSLFHPSNAPNGWEVPFNRYISPISVTGELFPHMVWGQIEISTALCKHRATLGPGVGVEVGVGVRVGGWVGAPW